MADPVAYFTLQEHVDDLGEDMFLGVYDDQSTGSVESVKKSSPVALVIRNAHAFARSWFPNLGGVPADNTDPDAMDDLVRCAALMVAKCFAYQRRHEVGRTYGCFPGGAMYEQMIAMFERIQSGIQRLEKPVQSPEPNQGGLLGQDGPKAFVIADPIDNESQGDF